MSYRRGRPETELTVTTVEPVGGLVRISCAGEIDESTAPLLEAAIEAAAPASARIEIDLAEVEFIDSTGIATLVRHSSEGYDLALVDIPAHVRRLLEIIGLADYFPR